MSIRLVVRSTPYGRILVPVDPVPADAVPAIVDDVLAPASGVTTRPDAFAALRAAFASVRPTPSPRDARREQLRAETQAAMDRADAVIETLYADYLQRLDEADPAAVPSPDEETPDAPRT